MLGKSLGQKVAASGSVALATIAGAAPALAHPGHGLDASGVGLAHFLLDLAHGGGALAIALALSCIAVGAATVLRARRHHRR